MALMVPVDGAELTVSPAPADRAKVGPFWKAWFDKMNSIPEIFSLESELRQYKLVD